MPIPDQMIHECAPGVGVNTMRAIVRVESHDDPWALYDNTARQRFRPSSLAEAAQIAARRIAKGHSVDMGLAQVNSTHLSRFGASPADALDPCTNLRMASRVLTENYWRAASRVGQGPQALLQALSAYNTGSLTRGGRYVGKVLAAAMRIDAEPVSRWDTTRVWARYGDQIVYFAQGEGAETLAQQ